MGGSREASLDTNSDPNYPDVGIVLLVPVISIVPVLASIKAVAIPELVSSMEQLVLPNAGVEKEIGSREAIDMVIVRDNPDGTQELKVGVLPDKDC